MARQRVLIIEDDKHISKLIKYNLEKAGYDCETAADADRAFKALDGAQIDLIILDIMLPGMDGFELCRSIKQDPRLKAIPVIMLTAKKEEVDRIVGLELGADDYMTKPFSPRELVLRVKAVLRRGKAEEEKRDILTIGDLTINIPEHIVLVKGRQVKLTLMEFKLLATLVARRRRVQTREVLLTDVWGLDSDIDTRTVDTHVKRLREKLGKHGGLIESVRGVGYRIREEADE
ncbi:MAG: response regulator transcription factor [Candidatus Omnitrophica bacterium]|nr:response regulator transcription factor [Candidatus Omnitrophota bacterium]